jgi:hypothetical protein
MWQKTNKPEEYIPLVLGVVTMLFAFLSLVQAQQAPSAILDQYRAQRNWFTAV